MALIHALLRYKEEGRITSFEIHTDKKATISLTSGRDLLVYMSDEYIIGEAEVIEAVQHPAATTILYNNWDSVTHSAYRKAGQLGIEVHKFGAFGHQLDVMNARRYCSLLLVR